MRVLAALVLLLAATPAVHAGCAPPAVEIVESQPLRATLRWMPREGATGYFLQYSTGKFPTQLSLEARPGEPLTAELVNLRPGTTTTVEFCEAVQGGRCPGPDSATACTSLIEVPVPWAYSGTEQPDPHEAVCAMEPGSAMTGQPVGYPEDETVIADSAQTCCSMCAWVDSRLPYQPRCTHFAFDESSGQCRYLREAGAAIRQAGTTSGEVRAWPRPKEN